jgi:hypothetical protein
MPDTGVMVDGGRPDGDPPVSFCATTRCGPGTVCCESLMRCLGSGESCPGVVPPDAGTSFCATTRCAAGTTCCEASRSCIPEGAPCGGTTVCRTDTDCSLGLRCCPTTGRCNPPGMACIAPDAGVDAGTDGGTVTRCTNRDGCGRGQCVFPENVCVREGVCIAAITCLRAETFCACTGETYLACRPDRPTRARGACPGGTDGGTPDTGTGTCATDRDCPSGQACCGASGRCYDPGCLACCMFGVLRCTSNRDCSSTQYCAGEGCGTPGTCQTRPVACMEIYSPVCGCDARTYPNSCYAASSGVRFAFEGICRGTP